MEELVKLVATKVGISEEQARQAVELVLGYMKDKMPESLSGQVEAALEGDLGGLEDLVSGLGGLFGDE
jgi:uncharacterized protein (DUF2267 family)